MSEHQYWLGFNLVQHIGAVRIQELLAYFGSLEKAWNASESQLRTTGLPGVAIKNVLKKRMELDLKREMQKVYDAGITIVTLLDDDYPAILKTIDDPPALLYIRGQLSPQDNLALAIVGTRKATRYGYDATFMLAKHCAEQGVTIVSGLAQG
ncbi:MAG: DNA-processing protein DprA, partial [Aggregatilineales bacterium]